MENSGKIFADRIGGIDFKNQSGYKMEAIKAAKRRAQAQFPGRFFLDMGIGEPDEMAPDFVIEELCNQALLPVNQKYADNGCQEFKSAAAKYMSGTFGVTVDDQKEIVHCVGAKSALSLLPLCFVNPGDLVISTHPGYPILDTHVRYLGGEIFSLPLLARNHYLPQLSSIPEAVAKKAKIISVNYPNNPTSAPATEAFFEELVAFAKKNHVLIINDAAYASLADKSPLSILQIPGAKELAIEVHTMSKAYNMTGWRLGWVCGNANAVEAFSLVKNNSDSGQFLAIQRAAVKALQERSFPQKMARKYHRRKRLIKGILSSVGFEVYSSSSGFFLYVKMPRVIRYARQELTFSSAENFSYWLLESLGIVTVAWNEPEPAVRFSMTFLCRTEKSFAAMLSERLSGFVVVY